MDLTKCGDKSVVEQYFVSRGAFEASDINTKDPKIMQYNFSATSSSYLEYLLKVY